MGAVADLAKDFVIVHNEIQTLRKEVGEMKKALTGLSSMQSEHLAALQSGKRSNSMVRYTPVALSLAPWAVPTTHCAQHACPATASLLLQDRVAILVAILVAFASVLVPMWNERK